MCDEAVDDFLLAIKFVPDWFVRSKMIKTPYNAFFTDGYILFLDEDSDSVTFSSDEKGILSVDLNNITWWP